MTNTKKAAEARRDADSFLSARKRLMDAMTAEMQRAVDEGCTMEALDEIQANYRAQIDASPE